MDDATTRVREVTNRLLLAAENACCYLTTEPEAYLELRKAVGAAADILLNKADSLRVIDTRTHAAVPREPSEEDVERLMRALHRLDPNRHAAMVAFTEGDYEGIARAAIAALVGTQTQGGDDAPP